MYREIIKAKNSGFAQYLEEEGETLEEFLPEMPVKKKSIAVPYRVIGWVGLSVIVCATCMYEWRVCFVFLLFGSVSN